MKNEKLCRRDFIRIIFASGTALSAGVLLQACGGGAAGPASSAAPSTAPARSSAGPSSAAAGSSAAAQSAPGASKYGGTLKLLANQGPATDMGNPPLQDDYVATYCLWPVIEKLVRYDEDNKIIPTLAESMNVADDLKSITFKLRQGVKFHDGTDFNAAAAKWNLDFDQKTGRFPWMVSVEAVNDSTLRMDLKYWDNTIPMDVARLTMVSPTAVQKKGPDWAKWNPVGTGPFKFQSYQRDQSLKMVKNQNYWHKGQPYLDEIDWVFIANDQTRVAAFLAGDGHVIQASNKDAADLVSKGYVLVHQPTYGSSIRVLEFDSKHKDSPYSDQRVRQAVWYAIDREAMVKARGFGLSKPMEQFASPGMMGYISDLPKRGYNPAKAKQLLAEAGHANGFKTTLYPNPGGVTDPDEMVAIQGYLKDVGIDVNIVNLDQAAHNKLRYQTGWQNGMIAVSYSTQPLMTAMLKSFMSDQSITKATQYTSPEFNTALHAALVTKEPDPKLIEPLNRMAWEGAFVVPYEAAGTAGRLNVKQKTVNDFGINTGFNWFQWTPEVIWLSKK